MNTRSLIVFLILCPLAPSLDPTRALARNGTSIASIQTDGGATNSHCSGARLSADGRYMTFSSGADNLVANDQNGEHDVFLRDLVLGETTRISVSSAGIETDGYSQHPAISADGRFVVFSSEATNLVFDTNDMEDVFLHDRTTGTTRRLSITHSEVDANGQSGHPVISGDGRWVAFESDASNLVSGDDNGAQDIFLIDTTTDQIVRISVDSLGNEGQGTSSRPALSLDGRFVVFASGSPLVPDDMNDGTDIYRYEIATGAIQRISLDSNGNETVGGAQFPAVSGDGQRVAFHHHSDLVPEDLNNRIDVYLRDLQTEETLRISVDSLGNAEMEQSGYAAISADGRYVAFESWARLSSDDMNSTKDVYLRDLLTSTTVRVSLSVDLGDPDTYCDRPSISADGRFVGFLAGASNLVENDGYDGQDAFVRDVASCSEVRFRSVGQGKAGSGGIVPFLVGAEGDCEGSYVLVVGNGLGEARGLLWVGRGIQETQRFGGSFYVDLGHAFFTRAIRLGGAPGEPGDGHRFYSGADISSFSGRDLILQAAFADPDATQGISMTNALEIKPR